MQMLRAITMAKNAASWLPRAPLSSSKPNFAQALLGKNYAFAARSVFNGGPLSWRNRKGGVKGVSSLTAETQWGSARKAGNVVQSSYDLQREGDTKHLFRGVSSSTKLICLEAHLLQCCESGAIIQFPDSGHKPR